jgi:hypothetical protein
MPTSVDFFNQNNIIFTSCTIKNPIDPDNPSYSTQPVTRDMIGSTPGPGFKSMIKKSTKYDMKVQ